MSLRGDAERLVKELRDGLNDYTHGWRNDQAIAHLTRICGGLRACYRDDDYALGKISEMERWIDILYSPRKHQRYPGGAQGVWGFIWGISSTLNMRRPQEGDRGTG